MIINKKSYTKEEILDLLQYETEDYLSSPLIQNVVNSILGGGNIFLITKDLINLLEGIK